MKKSSTISGVIYDIKKFAVHDGPGIRTTVFFKGCPLSCWWCHNPESQNPDPEPRKNLQHKSHLKIFRENIELIGASVTVRDVIDELKKDRIFFEESGGGVTFSGGEPLMQPDFLQALLHECKNMGLNTAVDTCGYAAYEIFQKISPFVDVFLFDLKLVDNVSHKKYTGVSNQLILENLKRLTKTAAKIIIRIPLIPGITDTEKNLNDIITFLLTIDRNLPVDLLPYNQIGESKYERLERKNLIGAQKTQSAMKIMEIESKFQSASINVLPR